MGHRLTERQLDALIVESGIANGKRSELGRWIRRGDGVAVYRNMGDGKQEFVSFGGRHAKINLYYPPQKMPATTGVVGWEGFRLVGWFRIG